jgi:hypothetical protein
MNTETGLGMAEVLADHYPNYQWHRDLSENLWTCTSLDCSFASRGFEQAIAHQAAGLTTAGFGDVREAKAVALEEAADKVLGPSDVLLDGATCRWIAMELKERAAAVRGEG